MTQTACSQGFVSGFPNPKQYRTADAMRSMLIQTLLFCTNVRLLCAKLAEQDLSSES